MAVTIDNAANWYEDRLAQEQAYVTDPEARTLRVQEEDINCLNATGIPKPLARISRIPKHDTTQLIPSDGFNTTVSTNKAEIVDPAARRFQEKPV